MNQTLMVDCSKTDQKKKILHRFQLIASKDFLIFKFKQQALKLHTNLNLISYFKNMGSFPVSFLILLEFQLAKFCLICFLMFNTATKSAISVNK